MQIFLKRFISLLYHIYLMIQLDNMSFWTSQTALTSEYLDFFCL